mgnify:CR=1 FL=1
MMRAIMAVYFPVSEAGPASWNPFRLQGRPFFEDKNRAFWTLQTIGLANSTARPLRPAHRKWVEDQLPLASSSLRASMIDSSGKVIQPEPSRLRM